MLIKVPAAVKEELTAKCLKNMLVLAARKAVNDNFGEIDDVCDWMINHTLPVIDLGQKMFNYAERKMLEDPETKKHLLEFSHNIGLNIGDMAVEKDYMPLTPEMIQFMQASGRLSEENVNASSR